MYERPFIDSLDFSRHGRRISGQIPLSELPRLQESLASQQGVLDYILQGGMDHQGRPVLDICLHGHCQLRCQRCLGALDYAIEHEMRLMLCDQAGLDEMDDDEEDFDGILAEAHMDVIALLEDEILLGLPIAPRHDVCKVAEGINNRESRHPFSVLEKLKHN